ncbi:substrate-binding domain-containing protein [Silvibacterium bohemicum]|nr:substrate-binding domain-containing protein [Silvibacterium bohemicum]
MRNDPSRRRFLVRAATLTGGLLLSDLQTRLLAQELSGLDVASAGAIGPMLDGVLKVAAAKTLKLDLHTHAQGADAVAKLIVEGSLRADVFIPVTSSPMFTVMHAGFAGTAFPIARTELVLVYSPKSRFASQFEAAANGKANWWEVLQQPGFRIGRGNPAADPGARAIIFAIMLAARKYNQANLVEKVLGTPLNQEQMVSNVQERLQSGELDASASYKIGIEHSHLPYIALPEDINLSRDDVHTRQPEISVTVGEHIFYPEPLIFYAAPLKNSANAAGAASFVQWLQGPEAQTLFRKHQFDLPGNAPALRA